jgi:ATP-dependent RNA helicase RhlE
MVATDDIALQHRRYHQVTHVINFDVPLLHDDVTTIGRADGPSTQARPSGARQRRPKWRTLLIRRLINQPVEALPLPEEVVIEETPLRSSRKWAMSSATAAKSWAQFPRKEEGVD